MSFIILDMYTCIENVKVQYAIIIIIIIDEWMNDENIKYETIWNIKNILLVFRSLHILVDKNYICFLRFNDE